MYRGLITLTDNILDFALLTKALGLTKTFTMQFLYNTIFGVHLGMDHVMSESYVTK